MIETNTRRIGYILRSYPRLSQTFIVNEILALEQLGLRLHLFPITNPRERVVQAQVAQVRAPVDYLEATTQRGRAAMLAEHLAAALAMPVRYARALSYILRSRELDAGYTAASRWECFTQALYLTRLLRRMRRRGQPIDHLHAGFAHDPALIALLAHKLTGISYSFTAHARDLFQIPRAALTERIAAASAVVTCCAANLGYLTEAAPQSSRDKIRLIHHGVDLSGFQPAAGPHPPAPSPAAAREGGKEYPSSVATGEKEHPSPVATGEGPGVREPLLILSVGRLVEKKGFPDLLLACAQLKQMGQRFRCAIYGEGPLRGELAALIERLGLAGEVTLPGAVAQQDLIPVFQRAGIFALAPFVTEDGDRDGVPNVLVEAMACGLPVVATAVAGIPELVADQRDGLLVPPREPAALAAALATLLGDAALRERLGAAARRTVVEGFDLRAGARELAGLFERAGLSVVRGQLSVVSTDN